jgi:ABC-type nitrate/sulfonate/bicarbonate transport system ATPase subunit
MIELILSIEEAQDLRDALLSIRADLDVTVICVLHLIDEQIRLSDRRTQN